jgi:choline transport protein
MVLLLSYSPGLIVLGSDLAFESIISGGGVTLQIGYVTPVIVVRPYSLHFYISDSY